jgi:hypothetical protein
VLACRSGFLLRCNYDLGCRVIIVWIGRTTVVAIPWPYADKLTIAKKTMSGEVGKPMRRDMTSRVKCVHAHTTATNSRTCVKGHEE